MMMVHLAGQSLGGESLAVRFAELVSESACGLAQTAERARLAAGKGQKRAHTGVMFTGLFIKLITKWQV